MRLGRCILLSLLATMSLFEFTSISSAQTLTEKLIAEDPAELAHQARQDGDIVRGAILFHQGNINCAKCHRPTSEQDRIGPDLGRIEAKVTDEFLIESILQPSTKIKEGFETVIALTVDGQTIDGLKISEDGEKLVIRDSQNVDNVVTIQRKDIEATRPGTLSSMPGNLADQLKNRQQFLDLLRYVIDVKERGPYASSQAVQSLVRRELSPELKGVVLIQKLNCAACHSDESLKFPIAAKKAPRLHWSAKHLNPDYLETFIANPHRTKPGTTMPDLFGNLNDDERIRSAKALTHYLLATIGNEFTPQQIDLDSVPRGFELFHSVGCVACHSPRDQFGAEQPFTESAPLGELSIKYSVRGLTGFLEKPHAVRPSGHMPNMQLTHWEAVEISNFLLQSSKESNPDWAIDSELVPLGESLFGTLNCTNCHTDLKNQTEQLSSELDLAHVNPDSGCLSSRPGDWPNFHLTQPERESIQATLSRPPVELDLSQQIDISLKAFNCLACHDRDNLGGVTSERNPHFQTTNLNLGDQGRIPPTLTGVGAKLNSNWMRDVIVNGRSIRPYMNTRMPQFGEENVGHLLKLFESNDHLPDTKFAEFKDQKKMREKGLELAGNRGLNCVACHTYKYKLSDTMPAVDLTEMSERLKKDWFFQYMLEPQKYSLNTVMPSFWPEGQAIRTDIAGRPREQVEALWQYLLDGRQAGTPRGVVREPLEIVVTNEAKMLRRSYPDIGKRGIGVGYPGGVNLIFDAEQLRLAAIWQGKFVDPSGVWKGQGSGVVRPMNHTIKFSKGPELDDASAPWVVDDGRPPNHQFKGYVLDQDRRPTFRYIFDSVQVEDFFTEVANQKTGKTHLRRSILLSSKDGREHLNFRIMAASEIQSDNNNNAFSVGEQLRINIVSDHRAKITTVGDGKRLEIPIELALGTEQTLIIEYVWD